MAKLQLTEIKTSADAQAFLDVNVKINKSNPNYIKPLDKDIDDVFNPKKIKHLNLARSFAGFYEMKEVMPLIATFLIKQEKLNGILQ